MSYDRELQFIHRIFEQLHIPFSVYQPSKNQVDEIDMGLRHSLGLEWQTYREWDNRFSDFLKSNIIYHLSDEFFCQYAFLLLPDMEPASVLMIGPYLTTESERLRSLHYNQEQRILKEWVPVLEGYYKKLPILASDDIVMATLNALGDQLWGSQNYRLERVVRGLPESWTPLLEHPTPDMQEAFLLDVHALEKSYAYEKKLIYEVSHGHTHNVQLMLSNIPRHSIEDRTDPIRNLKNYSVIMNTLLRKAAEEGGVHPLHIDQLSSGYAKKIESVNRRDIFFDLWNEMAQKYCQLVQKHTTENYSQIVQQIILRIEFDLTADLTLSTMAELLNINASYLSSLFKKEVGIPLTEYVNQRRVEHAMFLLTSTRMNVSDIAQSCGIPDDNYFIKLFKKHTGLTPTVFRKEYKRL